MDRCQPFFIVSDLWLFMAAEMPEMLIFMPVYVLFLFIVIICFLCYNKYNKYNKQTKNRKYKKRQKRAKMNKLYIAAEAGPEVAEKLLSDSYFNNHIAPKCEPFDAGQLDEIIQGATVLGAEPVDYPLTDGLYIYLKRPGGQIIALLIDTDLSQANGYGSYEVLTMSKTTIAGGEAK